MPSNGFTLAVFIGCKPDVFFTNGFSGLFKFGNNFFLFWINFVMSKEIIVDFDWRFAVFSFFGN